MGPASSQDQSWVETDRDVRCFSLLMAVLHHGLSNIADKAVPSRPDTVLQTAKHFEPYVQNGTLLPNGNGRKHNRGKTQ